MTPNQPKPQIQSKHNTIKLPVKKRPAASHTDRRRKNMTDRANQVCPVEYSGSLDNKIRRLLHNPQKILQPYIKEGMTALDVGCGPGFFTIPMANLTGASGRVIAADLQQGMLDKVKEKITGTNLENRITLHKCKPDRIGVTEPVDFILLFYMVHEIPYKQSFFDELKTIMKPSGTILIVEPPFHVSKAGFEETLKTARTAGFTTVPGPGIPLNKSAVLTTN